MSINGLGASLLLALLFAGGCARGRVDDSQEFPSPDGRYVATFLLVNFGGTVSDCPEVELRGADEPRGTRGNVFRGYKTYRLKVEWTSSTNLVVHCSPDCHVDRHVKKWKDVNVTVIQDEAWMLEDRLQYLDEKRRSTNAPAASRR